jgi:hypothetical protein
MRKTLLAILLLLVLPGAASAQRITLGAGLSFSSISSLSGDYDASSGDLGWMLGGNVRIGKTFFVAPGLWWGEDKFNLKDDQGNVSDGISLKGFQIPVMVGVGFDLKVLALDVYAGPTLKILTGVAENRFDLVKDDFKSTAFGGQVGATVEVLFLSILGSYEIPFTDLYHDAGTYGGGKLGVGRIGLGFHF